MPPLQAIADTSLDVPLGSSGQLTAPAAIDRKPRPHEPMHPAFEQLYSREGHGRGAGTIRSLITASAGKEGVIALSGGLPPTSLFPFASLSAACADGTSVRLDGPELSLAQQYNLTMRGNPALLAWASAHVAALHRPPAAPRHEVMIANGGNNSIDMVLSLFLDRGDAFLVEEYSYPVAVESIARPKGFVPVGVPIDAEGIVPEALQALLARLAAEREAGGGSPFPKLLYTIPHGQNPTGCSVPLARKRAVYDTCRRHGVLILEDDPYCYIQYGAAALAAAADPRPQDMPGLASAATHGSYLGLDLDGRVIRVDSFAKFLAPGLRLGWVTAAPPVIQKLSYIISTNTVGPCSLSQALVAATLSAWGEPGLDAHLRRIQAEYARRARLALGACTRELAGLADWAPPSGGMFLWLRLAGEADSTEAWREMCEAGVMLVPGRPLHWRGHDPSVASPFLRLSFSMASDEGIVEGVRLVGEVLRRQAALRADGGAADGASSAADMAE